MLCEVTLKVKHTGWFVSEASKNKAEALSKATYFIGLGVGDIGGMPGSPPVILPLG